MKVQLLSFPGCPSADVARDALRQSLIAAACQRTTKKPTSPVRKRRSRCAAGDRPTILVDGNGVARDWSAGLCCRPYPSSSSRGAPSDEMIRPALTSRPVHEPVLSVST